MLYYDCIYDVVEEINAPDYELGKYDEIWLITRQMKPLKNNTNIPIKWVSDLAPTEKVFVWARNLINNHSFSEEIFKTKYTPWYLLDLANNSEALNLVNFLKNTNKNICLCCYCRTDHLCHRKILKNLIDSLKNLPTALSET